MFDSLDDKRSYLNDFSNYDLDSINPDLIFRKNDNYNNLEINLKENNKYFNISNQVESYNLNNDQLDITLGEFTSNITFAEVNSLNRDLKFSDQSIFQGTINNDLIKVEGKSVFNPLTPLNISTSFLGTPGNDFYYGDKSSIDLIDYSNLEDFNLNNLGYKVDIASGLKIYDKNSFLNIESNNSPLINKELNLDSLIVNKNDLLSKIELDNIDIIEDIELLRLSPNDDIVNIGFNNKDNIYDFISGDDIVVYTAENIPNDFCNFLNLDKFQWRPLDSSGNKITDDKFDGLIFRKQVLNDLPPKELRNIVDQGKKEIKSGIIMACCTYEEKVGVAIGVTEKLVEKFDAVQLVKEAAEILGGKGGGGRKDFAQAGGINKDKIDKAFEAVSKKIN